MKSNEALRLSCSGVEKLGTLLTITRYLYDVYEDGRSYRAAEKKTCVTTVYGGQVSDMDSIEGLRVRNIALSIIAGTQRSKEPTL